MKSSADQLPPTPAQVEGPYYPVRYRQDEGNNLRERLSDTSNNHFIIVAGHLFDINGKPLGNRLVEIWQADYNGRYDHPKDERHSSGVDNNFQYWGKMVTDQTGRYHFKTIKPAPYNDAGEWRTPHIHFKIFAKRNQCVLTTQMYFTGEALNDQDDHLSELSQNDQSLLLVSPNKSGEKFGFDRETEIYQFDIVLNTHV